jgi:MoaA/NifB/PqqE/SkfB family radical SAM enzyme
MLTTGLAVSTLQIHPSLRCNLRCKHCYTNSGPDGATMLRADAVKAVISGAAKVGYHRLSVSGGEPFLYPHLAEVLRAAKQGGMATSVVTNGYFLTPAHLDPVRNDVDVVVVSLDGPRELHDRMRGATRSFDRLEAGLETLRSAGMPFGLLHTLTDESWPHLEWVLRFALRNGAKLLQIHPLEAAGRGVTMRDQIVAHQGKLRALLDAANAVSEATRRIHIHVDLATREQALIAFDPARYQGAASPETVQTLVMRADGLIVPLTESLDHRFALGNAADQTFARDWERFATRGWRSVQAMFSAAHRVVMSLTPGTVFNPYALLERPDVLAAVSAPG